jgi:hypothetical protein
MHRFQPNSYSVMLCAAPWWWWKARPSHLLSRSSHHARPRTHPQRLRHRLLLRLIFTLVVYALPFVVGLTAGLTGFHSGAGVIGALIVGLSAGVLTLFVGQIAFASVRPVILRTAIGLLYAVPAGIAGYHAALGLSQIAAPSLLWREVLAWIGAFSIGGTAWARMSLFVPPDRRQGVDDGGAQATSLAGASRAG